MFCDKPTGGTEMKGIGGSVGIDCVVKEDDDTCEKPVRV